MISPTVKFVAVVLCISGVFAMDEYITEVQEECTARSDFYSCGKYEVAKYISKKVAADPTKVIDGVVEVITLEQPETTANLFPAARQMSGDSEFKKFVKFLQRQTDAFLGSRALSIFLPDSAKIVNPDELNNELVSAESKVESRSRKRKKAALLLPLIMLFKLFKVKVLVAAVLFGVLFIKKALVFLFLLAPSYLQMLKVCKTPQHPHGHVEEHDFGGTGYGYGHTAHAHHGGYAKDWGNSRAYTVYRPM